MRPRRCRYFLILRAFAGRIRGWARLEESGLEILRWAPNHTCPFLAALSGRGCRVSGLFRRGASTGPPFAPLCPRQRNRTVARGKLRGWAPRSFAGTREAAPRHRAGTLRARGVRRDKDSGMRKAAGGSHLARNLGRQRGVCQAHVVEGSHVAPRLQHGGRERVVSVEGRADVNLMGRLRGYGWPPDPATPQTGLSSGDRGPQLAHGSPPTARHQGHKHGASRTRASDRDIVDPFVGESTSLCARNAPGPPSVVSGWVTKFIRPSRRSRRIKSGFWSTLREYVIILVSGRNTRLGKRQGERAAIPNKKSRARWRESFGAPNFHLLHMRRVRTVDIPRRKRAQQQDPGIPPGPRRGGPTSLAWASCLRSAQWDLRRGPRSNKRSFLQNIRRFDRAY